MRYVIIGGVLLTLLLLNAKVIDSGNKVRIPLWNGMFSFATPKDWLVNMADNLLTAYALPGPNSISRILFTTPNPFFQGSSSEFLQAQLALFLENFGGVVDNIDDEGGTVDGLDTHCCTFTMQSDNGYFLGAAFAFDFSGCKVFALAMAPEDEFEKYEQVFSDIICSYETDEVKLADFQRQLLATAEKGTQNAC